MPGWSPEPNTQKLLYLQGHPERLMAADLFEDEIITFAQMLAHDDNATDLILAHQF